MFAYWLSGWRPWEPLPETGTIYREATTMTMAGIVMGQVGAAMAWRTNRQSIRSIGLLTNRLLLVGIAIELAMIAMLSYVPPLGEIFHTSPLGFWHWLFLLIWPPLVLGAEEARKAVLRRRWSGVSATTRIVKGVSGD